MAEFKSDLTFSTHEIADLFERTFTASENAHEGQLIGRLARALIEDTPEADRHICTVAENGGLAGCIFFSRMTFEGDERSVFMLAPVAISSNYQQLGLGQSLLKFGLSEMTRLGVDIAVTYGDPSYYCKVGFAQIGPDVIAPPMPLQMPQGWQAQSLTSQPLTPVPGASRCVPAFDDPQYW